MSGSSASKLAPKSKNAERKEVFSIPPPVPLRYCCVCGENNGNRMKCGHLICPEDLLNNTRTQINSNKHKISCAQCTEIFDMSEIFKFVKINEEAKRSMTKAIEDNLANSEGKVRCPSCTNYCQRQIVCQSQVKCDNCTITSFLPYIFCWYCSGKWKDTSNYRTCENYSCEIIKLNMIINPPMIDFNGRDGRKVTVPQIRICPQCSTFIELRHGCSQMRCRICNNHFCFICLKKVGTCNTATYNGSITCTPAPKQTI